jgi:stage V sporulation protein G
MEITEVRIYPGKDLVKAYATISFDNCFVVGEIRVMQGLRGTFRLISSQEAERRQPQQLAYPPMPKHE